jgi:glycogen phosphorylase
LALTMNTDPLANDPDVFARAMTPEEIKRELALNMIQQMGRDPSYATKQDWFYALAYFLRGRLSSARVHTWRRNFANHAKWVYYFSLELLPGRMLKTSLISLGLLDPCRQALSDLGVDLDELWEFETEPALGNGGLGRLAACMLESLTTLNYACLGYSIRYEYGMFRQKIENGEQVEHPENWLKNANPWEYARPQVVYPIQFNGRVTQMNNWRGEILCHWSGTDDVMAVGYDLPVIGLDGRTISSVRLWSAKATEDFNLTYFNRGNYIDAVQEKSESETLSKVLYPSDTTSMGRELRLKQEYFLVSASLQDILSRFERHHDSFDNLPDSVAIQLNDTHPVLAIPELMRLLVDVYRLDWARAWSITVRTFSFTNHTLLSEALESWPVDLIESLLPRHLQIIYEINHRFLRDVIHRYPGNVEMMRRLSIVEENAPKSVRMANLAIVGSHKVNGVSRMHTNLMRQTLFKDFDAFFPGRFVSLTNGISPRTWLNEANPNLAQLISSRIARRWLRDLEQLHGLAAFVDDEPFHNEFFAVKQANKQRLARLIRERLGIEINPESLFDLQVKRIHEYKRQLLNLLQVVHRYNRIRLSGDHGVQPRTVIFSGKAAPGYVMAKRIIQLINFVADTINNDPAVNGALKLVFVPNYDVQTAQDIIPAADLSQQISAAGTEASGTGNMKLALNGALTIATHDGANDEIAEAVGSDNVFMFGHEVAGLNRLRAEGYDPAAIYESNRDLKRVLDMIRDGYFAPEQAGLFVPIFDSLVRQGDHYMVLADYESYVACQESVDAAFQDRKNWTRKAILNVANVGRFSMDRLVKQYASEVWRAKPIEEEGQNA